MADPLLKVLIVDDEPLVGNLVSSLLERVGFLGTIVSTAKSALEVAAKKEVGLVITDIQMPDGDGIELCRDLTRLYPKLPVVAMSGSGPFMHNDDLQRALKAGARSIVCKPFRLDEFYQAVAIALGGREIVGQTGR